MHNVRLSLPLGAVVQMDVRAVVRNGSVMASFGKVSHLLQIPAVACGWVGLAPKHRPAAEAGVKEVAVVVPTTNSDPDTDNEAVFPSSSTRAQPTATGRKGQPVRKYLINTRNHSDRPGRGRKR